jgi:hypothetical protein
MPSRTVRKAIESVPAEIAQFPDRSYYVSLTAITIDDEESQLLNREIDCRCGVSLDNVLAVIKDGRTSAVADVRTLKCARAPECPNQRGFIQTARGNA